MVYVIAAPSGDKIRIQFDESKPVTKIKILLETVKKEEISKTVSLKKEV